MTRTILARQVWVMFRKRPLVSCNTFNGTLRKISFCVIFQQSVKGELEEKRIKFLVP